MLLNISNIGIQIKFDSKQIFQITRDGITLWNIVNIVPRYSTYNLELYRRYLDKSLFG